MHITDHVNAHEHTVQACLAKAVSGATAMTSPRGLRRRCPAILILTGIRPRTGRPGRPVPVTDPYNLYFTPDGKNALVMGEALARIDFRNPRPMKLRSSMHVPCAGVNHLDFTADGRQAVASCDFSAKLRWIDIQARRVRGTLGLGKAMSAPAAPPGRGYSLPQDVRLSPDGRIFYVPTWRPMASGSSTPTTSR
jgi:hypothetical protein